MPLSPFIMTLTYEHVKEDSQGTFAVQNRYEQTREFYSNVKAECLC